MNNPWYVIIFDHEKFNTETHELTFFFRKLSGPVTEHEALNGATYSGTGPAPIACDSAVFQTYLSTGQIL